MWLDLMLLGIQELKNKERKKGKEMRKIQERNYNERKCQREELQ